MRSSNRRLGRLLLATLLLAAPLAAEEPVARDLALLRKAGIDTSTPGLCRLLMDLAPGPELQARIERLVGQLAAPEYRVREAASRGLTRIGQPVRSRLEIATRHELLEVRVRAQLVLDTLTRGASIGRLSAAIRLLVERNAEGTLEPLLITVGHGSTAALRDQASRALRVLTRVPGDLPRLRAALTDDAASVRAAAAEVLGWRSSAEADLPPLRARLTDRAPAVQLAAAEALVRRRQTDGVLPLIELLDAEQVMLRVRAARLLRQASGQRFGFIAYDAPERRAKASARWRTWWAARPDDFRPRHPLADPASAFQGRVLVCSYTRGQLIELDLTGRELSRHGGLNYPWGVVGLSSGNRLVAEYRSRRVRELDPSGKTIWEAPLPAPAMSVRAMPAGGVLVATGSEVLELNRAKQIVWRARPAGRPVDARPLPDGKILVALQSGGRVVELDRAGQVGWSHAGLRHPMSAQRLPGGNTLIAESSTGRVIEVDRAGRIVWRKDGLRRPYDVQRLPDGRTLIIDRAGVRLVTPAGTERILLKGPGLCRAWAW